MSNGEIFFTKVWGFDPVGWPLVGFGTRGAANKLQREYVTGDWILLGGTKGPPTAEQDRGRLLGIVQVTNTIVEIEPILRSLGTEIGDEAYKEDGSFRWPQGFPCLTAYIFEDKPLTGGVLVNRPSNYDRPDAAYAMRLTVEEASSVRALQKTQVQIRLAPELMAQNALRNLLTKPGPIPSPGERQFRIEDGETWVYIFGIIGTRFFKIGRTNDVERRLDEFNKSPHAIWSGKKMYVVNSFEFPDAYAAHEVEQMIHKKLEKYTVGFECFLLPNEKMVSTILANTVMEYANQK